MGENSPELALMSMEEDGLCPDDKVRKWFLDKGVREAATVYDTTTVLIEQDRQPSEEDDEDEEDDESNIGTNLPFLDAANEEGLLLMSEQDAMSQGYVQHIISPDQIHLTINPGSTPMPRNIEGATLTLHSECPETKQKEVTFYHPLIYCPSVSLKCTIDSIKRLQTLLISACPCTITTLTGRDTGMSYKEAHCLGSFKMPL